MHPVPFMAKRAHLRNVAFGRKALKKVPGMTPARFDILYLLRREIMMAGPEFRPLDLVRNQSGIWKDLGLHRSTISKMLKRMEEMGWVRRVRSMTDRRTFSVGLTLKGLRRIWQAMRRIFATKVFRHTYEQLVCPTPDPWDEVVAKYAPHLLRERQPKAKPPDDEGKKPAELVNELYGTVWRIARHFGDRSRMIYSLGSGLPKPTALEY